LLLEYSSSARLFGSGKVDGWDPNHPNSRFHITQSLAVCFLYAASLCNPLDIFVGYPAITLLPVDRVGVFEYPAVYRWQCSLQLRLLLPLLSLRQQEDPDFGHCSEV